MEFSITYAIYYQVKRHLKHIQGSIKGLLELD